MKILVISNLYPPEVHGGAEVVAHTINKALVDAGHDVSVITSRPFSKASSLRLGQAVFEGIPVYSFYPLNLYHHLQASAVPYVVRAVWHCFDILNFHSRMVVRRYIDREKPDLVLTHNLTGIGFLIPLLLSRMRVKHVHFLHDVQLYNASGVILKGREHSLGQTLLLAAGYPAIMRRFFTRVPYVVSPSRFLLDFYRSRGFFSKSKTFVQPNPVATRRGRVSVRSNNRLRLTFIGRLSIDKGANGLVEAISKINSNALELTLAGIGPSLSTLSQHVRSSSTIRLVGWLDSSGISNLLDNSDIVVVPSLLYENSPTVVYEAIGHGVPVIVFDAGGAREIIDDGECGWVIKCGDWNELRRRIEFLCAHREEVRHASEQALKTAANLGVERYVRRLLVFTQT